jgi:predicted RNase H-like HicB family nuclease
MPGCVTQAETRAGVLERIGGAMRGWLAVMRDEHPELPAAPLAVEIEELEVAV